MTFWSLLETLFIGPLKLIFEVIFRVALGLTDHPAIAIIFLSLAMNVLVLPLYRRADAMQEQSRDVEAKLKDGVAHIKKTFSGDERMMMLQTYYRQNNYKPTDVMRGSVSLLLEIPFFMAAYQFLSHLQTLNGVSFGPIADLGAPDGLLVIGGVAINLLPVLMTLINVVSSALYLKGFPLKTKIQLYGMAAFFLVFLYTSPAGLVFYWTLNNLFSLCKNIVYRISGSALKDKIKSKLPKREKRPSRLAEKIPSRLLFVLGGMFLTVFVGVLIPSTFIAASPQEFVDLAYFYHPTQYVVQTLFMAAGTFLVWLGVFYWLANRKWKIIFERVIWVLCGGVTVNYMFFGTRLGILSNTLQYENGVQFAAAEIWINIGVLVALSILLWVIVAKWSRAAKMVLLTAVIALGAMSVVNVVTINSSIESIESLKEEQDANKPRFELSQQGKNVVVIMLDRAMGQYMPYLVNEKPELAELLDGFTYYSNTVSFGGHTNMGAPAMMGGYEYTPVEMNKRDEEPLVDKHNESLKVMPVLFDENGYKVTVCDAPYANYSWIPDLSIYDEYPEIDTYLTQGAFVTEESLAAKELDVLNRNRNFFCFGVMKSMPVFMQYWVYDRGQYNQAYVPAKTKPNQVLYGMSKAEGLSQSFMEPYQVLENLTTMTDVSEGGENNFLFLYNSATHEPMLMQEPAYVPSAEVNNTVYDDLHADRFTLDGKTLQMKDPEQLKHYQTNMACLLQIGRWCDYLREKGVYDNTKIIIAADHGYYLKHSKQLIHGAEDMGMYFPLLLVKDFDSHGFSVSDEFMTNADVPTIATQGTVVNPVNPFTGKPINSDEKTAHDQFVMLSHDWDVESNNGTTYKASKWAVITDNIWNRADWKFIKKPTVLNEHAVP